jgi:hypothetical protein
LAKEYMLSSMIESDDVARAAFEALGGWPGYQALAGVMNEVPELQVYLAGGVIRDFFLGRSEPPKDFDFFLGGPVVDRALTMLEAEGSMRTGPFGSPRWYPRGAGDYCDLIPIERFYNGLWRCEDIVDALNQFDFTGNAVAVDVRTGEFYNPQNGRRDMERRVMRMVRFDYPDEPIAPGQSISRRTVLWFRVLHYAAAFGLAIEPVTKAWLIRHRGFFEYADSFSATFFPVAESLEELLGSASDERFNSAK